MAYFFGGAFNFGTANDFNVDYFMDEDVLMVIVEARVGAFGASLSALHFLPRFHFMTFFQIKVF